MLNFFDDKTDIILNEEPFFLPEFKMDEIVKLVKAYPDLETAKSDFRKRKIILPSETAMVIIYDNKIVDYTDFPGTYCWVGTETKLQSYHYGRFLLLDVDNFEEQIGKLLQPNRFYIYELNIKDLHSFPLYIENPVPFRDEKYGELNVRTYCSVDARITNPFILLYQFIQSQKTALKGNDLFAGREDEIRQIFFDGFNELLKEKEFSFENLAGVEYYLSSIILPKLFNILYKGYGIHGNKINVNSILPDALSKDIIEEYDAEKRRE